MKYRFGSFNMNNMGMSAMTGRDFDRIAEIIKRENLDVVALYNKAEKLGVWELLQLAFPYEAFALPFKRRMSEVEIYEMNLSVRASNGLMRAGAKTLGKVANIGDDISSQYFEESEIFKKLVTGQFVTAEHKGQDSVQFRNYAKLFFAANELPKTADKSNAFLTRILPVPMLADFSKREDCDISLKDRHWTDEEMEYLLAISMEGLKRLMRNNGFTIPECVTKERKQYEIENNSVLAFLEDNPDIAGMPTNLAHAKFIDWCRMTGNRGVVSRTKFTREVCKATGLVSRNRRISIADESKVVKCFVVADNVADCA